MKDSLSGMNPVSIIALFAALSEASAATALPFLAEDNQDIYVWFLISFPSALTFMFFLTLNFNHKVLYAPSDFSNEKNFLKIFKRTAMDSKNSTHTEPADSPQLDHSRSLSRLLLHPSNTIDILYGGSISSKNDIERLLSQLSMTDTTKPNNNEHKVTLILLLKKQNRHDDDDDELISSLRRRSAETPCAATFAILDTDSTNVTLL